jgi:hypothetical protein
MGQFDNTLFSSLRSNGPNELERYIAQDSKACQSQTL